MKLLKKAKDGGPKSTVTGYWLCEFKKLFSIVLLKFEDGTRDEYHNHAFNSINWVLKGEVDEEFVDGKGHPIAASLKPVITKRSTFHRVRSNGTTWVLAFRGPWSDTWQEYDPASGTLTTLTHGREALDECTPER